LSPEEKKCIVGPQIWTDLGDHTKNALVVRSQSAKGSRKCFAASCEAVQPAGAQRVACKNSMIIYDFCDSARWCAADPMFFCAFLSFCRLVVRGNADPSTASPILLPAAQQAPRPCCFSIDNSIIEQRNSSMKEENGKPREEATRSAGRRAKKNFRRKILKFYNAPRMRLIIDVVVWKFVYEIASRCLHVLLGPRIDRTQGLHTSRMKPIRFRKTAPQRNKPSN